MARPAYMKEVISTWKVGTAATEFIFYGRSTPAKIAFPTATTSALAALTQKPVAMPASLIQRYPGDPKPFTRRAYTRQSFKYRRARNINSVTPGRRFWITKAASNSATGVTVSSVGWLQFTTTYSTTAIIEAHKSFGVPGTWVRTPSGVRYNKPLV